MPKKKPVDQSALGASQDARAALAGSPSATSPVPFVAPQTPAAPLEGETRSARWEGYGFRDYISDFAANETFFVANAIEQNYLQSMADPNWKFPALDSEEWKRATENIPEEKWEVLGKARSAEQLNAISFRLRDEQEREARLMEGGLLPYLAANVANPESLLMAMSTGGLGWVQKGNRLRRAVKFGSLAAAENMAQEAALASVSETRDAGDVAVAAAAGMILGGGLGAVFGKNADAAEKALHRDIDDISKQQAADAGFIGPPREDMGRALARSEKRLVEIETNTRLDAEEARLRKIVDDPNAPADRLTHTYGDVDAALQRAKRSRDEAAAILSKDAEADIAAEAQKLARKDQRNRYAMDRAREAGSADDAVHPAVRRQAEELVAAKRTAATSNLAKGNDLVQTLQSALDRANRIRGAEIDLEVLTTARRTAKDTRGLIEALPSSMDRLKAQFAKRLDDADAEIAAADAASQAAAARTADAPEAAPEAGFGTDSASAARLDVSVEQSMFDTGAQAGAATRLLRFLPRFDYASILRSPKLPEGMRERIGRYLGDPVPAKGEVSKIGASETATRLRDQYLTKFHQVYEGAFKEFLKETGANPFASLSRTARRAFGSLVTHEIKGIDTGSASAVKAAARLRQVFSEIGAAAKEAQVKGFEEFTPDAKYLPRVPDRPKIAKNLDKYGTDAITAAIKQAVVKGYDDLGIEIDPAVLNRIADGYFARMQDLALGIENEALSGLRLTDVDQIAGTLRLAGVDEETITDTVLRLRNGLQKTEGEGSARYAKSRTLMNEDATILVRNRETNTVDETTLRDLLFHDDAEALFQTYNHTMSGWIALAREAGVRSKADHQKLVDAVKRELPTKEAERTSEALEHAFKFTIGQPLYDTKNWKTMRRIGRALRDWNFARSMNMVGFANISDSAAWMAPQYMRHVARHFPDMAKMFRRMQDGTIDHTLARQLEEVTSGGTDMLHNKMFSAYDDEPDAPISKLEHALRAIGRFTERNPLGIAPITTFNQRLMEIALSQRYVDNILGNANDLKLDRFRAAGISDEMLPRIKKELERTTEFDGRKLRSLDFAAFKDAEARDALIGAIHRESRRLVQEEDFSDTHPFMHSALGKMLMQFRRFGVVSYTKQLYRAAADRDIESATRLLLQVQLGSLSYAAQMYLYSLTKGEEAQEWREKYLTPSRIFFGGIARAGMFSLTPALMETLWQRATGTEGVFSNTRTTGLGNTLVAGIPTLDLASRLIELTGDVAQSALRSDKQFDRKDWHNLRSILPLQNAIVVKQVFDMIGNSLPEGDEDFDTDTASFIAGVEIDEQ